MKQKTPQEKKALSYAKDRRNAYGESDKGSPVSICRNKTFPKRAYRKNTNDVLQSAVGVIDLEKAEVVDIKVKEIRRQKWKKYPDIPLGKYLQRRVDKTRYSYLWKIRNSKNDKEINLTIEAEQEKDGRWSAKITELNDVLVLEETRQAAVKKVKALALRFFSDKFKNDSKNS